MFGRIQMETIFMVVGSFKCIIRFLHESDVTDVDTFDSRFVGRLTRRAAQSNQSFAVGVQ